MVGNGSRDATSTSNLGAIYSVVQRQPFGGWKRSAVGPTAKEGGLNYVATLARWKAGGQPIEQIVTAFDRSMEEIGTAAIDAHWG